MNWYFTVMGGHTHVRIFMNGGKCGDLCFRNDEFNTIWLNQSTAKFPVIKKFVNETPCEQRMNPSTLVP